MDIESVEFYRHFVDPYCGDLMNLNFINWGDFMPLLNFVKQLEEELAMQEIFAMLTHNNWRYPKVAAWIIGLNRLEVLLPNLINHLKSHPIHPEADIFNLLLFNTQDGNQVILNHVSNTLLEIDKLPEWKGVDFFQNRDIPFALGSLRLLDGLNETDYYRSIIDSGVLLKLEEGLNRATLKRSGKVISILNPYSVDSIDRRFESIKQAYEIVISLR
jgi:hypothetical protein